MGVFIMNNEKLLKLQKEARVIVDVATLLIIFNLVVMFFLHETSNILGIVINIIAIIILCINSNMYKNNNAYAAILSLIVSVIMIIPRINN